MIRLFRVFVPASTLALLAFEGGIVFTAFIVSIYLFLDLDPTDYLLNNLGLVSVALVSFSVLAGVYLQDLYSQVRVKSRLLLAQQFLMVAGITFLLQALISAVAPELFLPFRVALFGCLMSIVTMFIARLLFSLYVLPRVATERLLLIGESPLLDDIDTYLAQRPQLGIQVAGHVRQLSAPLTNLEELASHVHSNRIVVGMPGAHLAEELLELRFSGYSIQEAAATFAKISNREGLSGLGPTRLLYAKEFEPSARDMFFQAIGNILISAIAIIVLFPLMLLIAMLVWLYLHRSVLERQIRIGKGGALFTLYRFRVAKAATGSMPGDTFIGRFLSRTGLYALPQFFNVLRGDVSIVGPRPQRAEFVGEATRYIPFYPHRFKVKPGMTGLAQIEMRSLFGPPDCMVELEYDMYYLKYVSPTMDLFIALQSIKNILLWGGRPL
jgi:lipopolysaccharide/colanic/teichoic acid biosynthesis glycosyltransferase